MEDSEFNKPQGSCQPPTVASSPLDCPRRPSHRRSSILKPPKQRNPLQELDFNPNADEEQTVNVTRKVRRVSFATGTQVKEFVEVHTETANVTLWGSSYEQAFVNSDTSHQSDNSPPEENNPIHIKDFDQLVTGKINAAATEYEGHEISLYTNMFCSASTSRQNSSKVKTCHSSQQESSTVTHHFSHNAKPGEILYYSTAHRETSKTSHTTTSTVSNNVAQVNQLNDDMDLTKPVDSKIRTEYNNASPQSPQEYDESFNRAETSFWVPEVETGALDLTTKKTSTVSLTCSTPKLSNSKFVGLSVNSSNATLSESKIIPPSELDHTMLLNKTGFMDQMDLTAPNGMIYSERSSAVMDVTEFNTTADLSSSINDVVKNYYGCSDAICGPSDTDMVNTFKISTDFAENLQLSGSISIEVGPTDIFKLSKAFTDKTMNAANMDLTEATDNIKLYKTNETLYEDDLELTEAVGTKLLGVININQTVYVDDVELTETAGNAQLSQAITNKTLYADDMEFTEAGGKGLHGATSSTVYVDDMDFTEAADNGVLLSRIRPTSKTLYASEMDLTEAAYNTSLAQGNGITNKTCYADDMDLTEAANHVNLLLASGITNKTCYADDMEFTEVAGHVNPSLPNGITNKTCYADDMDLTEVANHMNLSLASGITNKTCYADDMEFTEVAGHVNQSLASGITNKTCYADDMDLTEVAGHVNLSLTNGITNKTCYADDMEFTEVACHVNPSLANGITNKTCYADDMEFTEVANHVNLSLTSGITNKTCYADDIEFTEGAGHVNPSIENGISNQTCYADDMDFTEVADHVNPSLANGITNKTCSADDMEFTEAANHVKLRKNISDDVVYAQGMEPEMISEADLLQLTNNSIHKNNIDLNDSEQNIREPLRLKKPEEFETGQITPFQMDSVPNKVTVSNMDTNNLLSSSMTRMDSVQYEKIEHVGHLLLKKVPERVQQITVPLAVKTDAVKKDLIKSGLAGHTNYTSTKKTNLTDCQLTQDRSFEVPKDKEYSAQADFLSHKEVISCREKEACTKVTDAVHLPQKRCWPFTVSQVPSAPQQLGCIEDMHSPPKAVCNRETENVSYEKIVFEVNQSTSATSDFRNPLIECAQEPEMPPTRPSNDEDCILDSSSPAKGTADTTKNVELPKDLFSVVNSSTLISTELNRTTHQLQANISISSLAVDKENGVVLSIEQSNTLTSVADISDDIMSATYEANSCASSSGILDIDCSFEDAAEAQRLKCSILDASRFVDQVIQPDYSSSEATTLVAEKHYNSLTSLETVIYGVNISQKSHQGVNLAEVNHETSQDLGNVEGREISCDKAVEERNNFAATLDNNNPSCAITYVSSTDTSVGYLSRPTQSDKNYPATQVLATEKMKHFPEQCAEEDSFLAVLEDPPLIPDLMESPAPVLEDAPLIPDLMETPTPVTLEDILMAKASSSQEWYVKELKKEEWTFTFLYKSLELKFILNAKDDDCEYANIKDITFTSSCTETSDSLCKFAHSALMQKFPDESLKSMCTTTQHVSTLLDAVAEQSKQIEHFVNDFFLLQDLYDLKMTNESVTFNIANFSIHVLFDVSLDINTDWKCVSPENIQIMQTVGKIDEAEIKQLAKGIPSGPHFLQHYIEEVYEYVHTLELYATPTLTADNQ